MENMLHSVHHTMLQNPNCGRDKWEDNHYAYDAQQTNADFVLDYLEVGETCHKLKCNAFIHAT